MFKEINEIKTTEKNINWMLIKPNTPSTTDKEVDDFWANEFKKACQESVEQTNH